MNGQVQKLFQIAGKSSRIILGLMSGTSLDGLDLALCQIHGNGFHTQLKILNFRSFPYETAFKNLVCRVFAKDQIRLADLSGLNAYIANRHAELIGLALSEWNVDAAQIDLIASHGQTVFHDPVENRLLNSTLGSESMIYPDHTLQIGDGDHIAVRTGIITVSDFRQKHVSAGGQGAPLAVYGDYLLFSDEKEDRILLNLGGIANFTYLPSEIAKSKGFQVFTTDTGPANTLLNQYVQKHFAQEMDEGGKIAFQGKVIPGLLSSLKDHPFFSSPYPRTTGPELFNLQFLDQAIDRAGIEDYSHPDIIATLSAFSAAMIANSVLTLVNKLPEDSSVKVYVSGGGVFNPHLMEMITHYMDSKTIVEIDLIEKLGIDPQAKEAALFAVLANEAVAGSPENVNGFQDAPAICMGKISFPT